MSPLNVRRYRAERLLRRDFEALRGRVIATARRRLLAGGVTLDPCDLEACYAQAWQGLYMAMLDGQEIANPSGWLVLVTFRRGIEEHRARRRGGDLLRGEVGERLMDAEPVESAADERDLAARLDDRMRLRQLFEGLCGRLSAREREAAVLCYLQGLPRSQAAERIGVSEGRMRKLMEGGGPGRPGVAGKVGALVETIRNGGWCEEQGSLMRGLAFGILDPDGERHRLALMHGSECPACRAYVASLRGLAAALPPVFLPWGLGAGVLAHVGEGVHAGAGAGAGALGGGLAGGGGASAGAGAGAPVGGGIGGALATPGAAGMGAGAGGSWLLAGGSVGAKLVVGCLVALGVGASCVALEAGGGHTRRHAHPDRSSRALGADAGAHGSTPGFQISPGGAAGAALAATIGSTTSTGPLTPAATASREFGPESGQTASASRSTAIASTPTPVARSASAGTGSGYSTGTSSGESLAGTAAPSGASSASTAAAQAAREFSPG